MGNLSQSSSSSIGYFFGIGVSSWFLCVLIFLSCQRVSSAASPYPDGKRSSVDPQIMALIEKAAKKLSAQRFQGDPSLLQVVDRANSVTHYKLPDSKRPGSMTVVYTRENIDTKKPVVVLSQQEDHLNNRKGQRKQSYVVLKQQRMKKGQKQAYYATFAYLRKFLPKDDPTEALQVGNETLRIEWDTWTLRGNVMNTEGKGRAFGWTTCADSVFVSCQEKTATSNPGKGDGHDYSDEAGSTDKIKDWGGGVKKSEAKIPNWGLNSVAQSDTNSSQFNSTHKHDWGHHENDGSGTTQGGDVTEVLDFFADLDDSPAEARTVSTVLQIITMSKFNSSSTTPTSFTGPPGIHRKFSTSKPQGAVETAPSAFDSKLADNIRDLIGGLANDSTGNDLVRSVLDTAMELVLEFNGTHGRAATALDGTNSGEPRADIFNNFGWKTQGQDLRKGSPGFEDVPFVGFGTCPYVKQSASSLKGLRTPEQAVNFYLTSLRNQCSKRHKRHLLRLFNKKILTINGDKTLSVPTGNKMLTTSKLTPKEIKDVSKAYEFAMFSQIFATEFRTPIFNSTAPDGSTISKNVFTIVSLALHTLTHTTRYMSSHFILFSRNLVQTLKSANTKALQDYRRLQSCSECTTEDKEISKNDIYSLQAIRQYIITGIRADVLVEDSHADYQKFCQTYKDVIAAKTKAYL